MDPAYMYRAICTKVVDGDTIYVDIALGFGVWMRKQIIRLAGINTPEIRGEERPDGLISKAFVAESLFEVREDDTLMSRPLILKTYKDKKGKYGRWIADVFIQKTNAETYWNLNEELVVKGLAEERDY